MSSIWLASWVGALLFFVAGFLTARRRRALAPAFSAAALPASMTDRDDRDDPGVVEAMRKQVATLRRELGDAVARERSLARLAPEVDRLNAELERERARARRGEELAEKLAVAERRARAMETDDGERRAVAVEMEVLRNRLADLDTVQDENARLKAVVGERDRLQRQLVALRKEVADLRATGLARRTTPAPTVPPAPKRSMPTERGTSQELESLLRGLSTAQGFRSAALADDLGLPIVGLGEHVNALSAFGGYVDDMARKARDFLPVGAIRRVAVQDEHRTTVSACSMENDDSRFVLVTLTAGPGPSTTEMNRILRGAARMF